jgi:hypothetical protein
VLIDFITYLLQTVMIAVTLIVVAVPEGLPMAISLSLAYSMRRMLKTNNLVRRMHACETMGATTVICTDKTGTLTQNQMQVAEVWSPQPQSATPPLLNEAIAANSTAQLDLSNTDKPKVLGNPTEGALLLWLYNQTINYRQLLEQAGVIDDWREEVSCLDDGGLFVDHVDAGVVAFVKADYEARVRVRLESFQKRGQRSGADLGAAARAACQLSKLHFCFHAGFSSICRFLIYMQVSHLSRSGYVPANNRPVCISEHRSSYDSASRSILRLYG